MKDIWRKVLYSLLGKIFKNQISDAPIHLNGTEKILIFRYDRIGDMVVSLPSFEFLRTKFPNVQICVLASEKNKFLLENYPYVDSIFILPNNVLKLIKTLFELRKQKFDLIINFVFHKTTKAGILANLIEPKAIKINLGHETRNEIYHKLFNSLVRPDVRWKVPMSEFLLHYLCQIFGLPFEGSFLERYNFWIPPESLAFAEDFFKKTNGKKYLLINITARLKWKSENYRKLAEKIVNIYPDVLIIFVCHPVDSMRLKEIVNGLDGRVYSYSSSNFYNVIALIKYVDIVFTPDTSIVHFANAFKKPIVFVHPASNSTTYEWQPNLSQHIRFSVASKDNFNEIGVERILESIKFFLDQIENENPKPNIN